jgi:hypothetical protein
MKYYLTQAGSEFVQEAHRGGGDAYDARKASNTGAGQQSGAQPSMTGQFAGTPRKGEVRVPEVGMSLPVKKKTGPVKKKTGLWKRLKRLLGGSAAAEGPGALGPGSRREGKEFVNEVLTQKKIDQIQKDAKLTPKQIADARKKELTKLNAHRKKLGLAPVT